MSFMDGFNGRSSSKRKTEKSDTKYYGDLFAGLDESLDDCLVDQAVYSQGRTQQEFRRNTIRNTESNYGWYTCPKCGKNFRVSNMDADHIGPKSTGGTYSTENGQMLCKHCNRSKQADTSDTNKDLARRKRELAQQRRDDIGFLREVEKVLDSEKKKSNNRRPNRPSTKRGKSLW